MLAYSAEGTFLRDILKLRSCNVIIGNNVQLQRSVFLFEGSLKDKFAIDKNMDN
ncbi:MAG: hypothetical protein ACM3XP_07275 [Nitrososphaerales archaeon]